MQGPSEFTIVGTLKTYDATPFLKDVKVPVLFTVGEFDEGDPPTVRKHAADDAGREGRRHPGRRTHRAVGRARRDEPRSFAHFCKSVDSTRSKP
jgi:hypothetical protein